MWQPFPSHGITSGIKLVCTSGSSTARKRFNVDAVMVLYLTVLIRDTPAEQNDRPVQHPPRLRRLLLLPLGRKDGTDTLQLSIALQAASENDTTKRRAIVTTFSLHAKVTRGRPPRPFFCKYRMIFCCWNRDVWVLPRASRRPKERAMDWGQSTASSTHWRKHRSKSPASSNEYSCLTENAQRKKRCTRMSRHFAANLAVSWSSSSSRIRWIRHHPNGHWSG